MATLIADLFKYNLWANLSVLDACANLNDAQLDASIKGTFGSVRETLVHIIGAEEGYIFCGPAARLGSESERGHLALRQGAKPPAPPFMCGSQSVTGEFGQ